MNESILEILMRRDGMTEKEAKDLIKEAQQDLDKKLAEGKEPPFSICEEWFGLEEDYILDLIDFT